MEDEPEEKSAAIPENDGNTDKKSTMPDSEVTKDDIAVPSSNTPKKKLKLKSFFYGFGVLFVLFLVWGFMPLQGTIYFGICKTFLELRLQYPSTIKYRSVDDFGNSVRIGFVHIDGFGEFRFENIQCYFELDETGQIRMSQAKINRRDIAEEHVTAFNPAIPGLVANPPNLSLPPWIPDNLSDLQFDTDSFRRPLNINSWF